MSKRMDPEILAIKRILVLLGRLDREARRRAIQYAVSFYGWPEMSRVDDGAPPRKKE